MTERLGFIGLGLMGTPIAEKLLDAGYALTVWGRSPQKLESILKRGATAAASPRALAEASDVILLCVTDTSAVEAVVFGSDGIAASADAAGKTLIDHSSIRPEASRDFAERLKAACGMDWLDAPVSGGPAGVARGSLVVMAGGEAKAFEMVQGIVSAYAARFTLMGSSGAGQATKLINQTLAGVNFAVVAEATQLALEAGIDAARIPEALAGGSADSMVLQEYMPKMVARDFEPAGTVSVILKDLETVAELAQKTGTAMPITKLVTELHRLLVAKGHGDEDNAALIRLYEKAASS